MVDADFAEFSKGRTTDAGADLLIAANGTVFPYRSLDISGDGWPDLVFVPRGDGALQVFNGGPEGFADEPTFSTDVTGGHRHSSVDLDLDGHLDLVVTYDHEDDSPAGTLYWGGPEGLDAERSIDLPAGRARGLAIGDIDQDGRLDIAISYAGEGEVRVFRGQDGRAIDANPFTGNAVTPGALSLVDLNGDGWLDLAVAAEASVSWVYVSDNASIQVAQRIPWERAFDNGQITPIDHDGDGVLTLLAVSTEELTGWGFTPQSMVEEFSRPLFNGGPTALALGDLGHNGQMNALMRGEVAGNSHFWTVSSFLGQGSIIEPGGGAALMTDLDGDGFLDFVTVALDPAVADGTSVRYGPFSSSPHPPRREDLEVAGVEGGWERSPGSVFDRRERYIFESRTFGLPDHNVAGRIEWTADEPETTAVAVQVRAAPSAEALLTAPWSGPGGRTDRWYEAPGRLPSDLDGMRRWQYRVRFTRGRAVYGPILREVRLSWRDDGHARSCATHFTNTALNVGLQSWQTARLADGGAVFVGQSTGLSHAVAIVTDGDGHERWRRLDGPHDEDLFEGVCTHPDGGFLAVGRSGQLDVMSEVWAVRYDASGGVRWQWSTDTGSRRRGIGCVWTDEDWVVVDLMLLNPDGVALVARRIADEGVAAAETVVSCCSEGGTLYQQGTVLRGQDDDVLVVTTRGSQGNYIGYYTRFSFAGRRLQSRQIIGSLNAHLTAARVLDDGSLLTVGDQGGDGDLGRSIVVRRSGRLGIETTFGMRRTTAAAALGDRTVVAGLAANELPSFLWIDAAGQVGGPTSLDLSGPNLPVGVVARADGGLVSFVANPLTIVRQSADFTLQCDP